MNAYQEAKKQLVAAGLLGGVSHIECEAWAKLNQAERRIVCKAAGVSEFYQSRDWARIEAEDRAKIKRAAKAAAQWFGQLAGAFCQ